MNPDAMHLILAAALVCCATFAAVLWGEVQHERDVMRGQLDAVRVNLYDARARLDVLERVRVEVVIHDLPGYVAGVVFE